MKDDATGETIMFTMLTGMPQLAPLAPMAGLLLAGAACIGAAMLVAGAAYGWLTTPRPDYVVARDLAPMGKTVIVRGRM
jgi:hypothetical protein